MRYDEFPPDESNDDHDAAEPRSGVPRDIALGILGLSVAVGLSIFLMRGMNDGVDPDEDVATSVEDPGGAAFQVEPSGELVADPEDDPIIEPQQSPADQLRAAQAEVEDLQTELAARDAELVQVKTELATRDTVDEAARVRARARQVAIEYQLTSLRTALAVAQDERDALRKDLKEALSEVDRQVAQNKKLRTTAVAYKEASSENLWQAFTNNAKVRICDRGTYKRRESCEQDLDAWFDAEAHVAFTSCVNTAQAIPMLWEADGAEVPGNAKKVEARDRQRNDEWYVVYCDPTLPENQVPRDITEETPQVFAMSGR